jgi:hypothetical protein
LETAPWNFRTWRTIFSFWCGDPYYDEGGHPMLGSALVRDPKFTDRVVAETRALLATVP